MNQITAELRSENSQPDLEQLVRERTREFDHSLDMAVYCMASLAETRETGNGYHIRRTQEYVRILAQRLSREPEFSDYLSSTRIDLMCRACPLHDIGKVAIPDRILLKQGPLNRTEWEEMKRHTIYGRDAIDRTQKEFGSSEFLRMVGEIAYTHHERWDGRGYPAALAGPEIPIPGRIMALADVYDALVSKRVYKSAYSHREAVEKIRAERGTQFDPQVVDAFLSSEGEFRDTLARYPDPDSPE